MAPFLAWEFYHFFPSREKIFKAAVDVFLNEYVSAFESICQARELPVAQRYELHFAELAKRTREYYGQLGGERPHWSIAYSLHERTMASLLPGVETLLTDALQTGAVKCQMELDAQTLSALLLRGVEAILHSKSDFNMAETKETEHRFAKCRGFIELLLEINGQDT